MILATTFASTPPPPLNPPTNQKQIIFLSTHVFKAFSYSFFSEDEDKN